MKIIAFAIIASLCWAAVTVHASSGVSYSEFLQSFIKCYIPEVSKIKESINTLPSFTNCDSEPSKNVQDLEKQKTELIKTYTKILDTYDGCSKVKSSEYKCNTGLVKDGGNLPNRIKKFVRSIDQVNDGPGHISQCLKDALQSNKDYFNENGKKVLACYKK